MNVGYHYTSLENWNRIDREGLIPYRVNTPSKYSNRVQEFAHHGPFDAIWVWDHDPDGESHTGNILFQALDKDTDWIVKLRVEYAHHEEYSFNNGCRFRLSHHGEIFGWVYHTKATADFIGCRIPPSRIALVGLYNIQRWPDWDVLNP